jgi:hypothetical protein
MTAKHVPQSVHAPCSLQLCRIGLLRDMLLTQVVMITCLQLPSSNRSATLVATSLSTQGDRAWFKSRRTCQAHPAAAVTTTVQQHCSGGHYLVQCCCCHEHTMCITRFGGQGDKNLVILHATG